MIEAFSPTLFPTHFWSCYHYKLYVYAVAKKGKYQQVRRKATFELCGHFRCLQVPWSFGIHWVRQYLVHLMDLAGRVNATVNKTGPIFTGLGHGKLSLILTLMICTNEQKYISKDFLSTHECLMTPYATVELSHPWYRWWLVKCLHQTITRTNANLLIIECLWTKFDEILI